MVIVLPGAMPVDAARVAIAAARSAAPGTTAADLAPKLEALQMSGGKRSASQDLALVGIVVHECTKLLATLPDAAPSFMIALVNLRSGQLDCFNTAN
jgi:hypothetical protein